LDTLIGAFTAWSNWIDNQFWAILAIGVAVSTICFAYLVIREERVSVTLQLVPGKIPCLVCEAQNESDAVYCKKCGKKIA
jgi:hypothetical protein